MTIIDVLEQDKIWRGQGGMPYKIDEMAISHRMNVLWWLGERAHQLYAQKAWEEEKYLHNAPDEVLRAYESESAHRIPQDPVQWLVGTPFVRALVASIRRDGAVLPDFLEIEGSTS